MHVKLLMDGKRRTLRIKEGDSIVHLLRELGINRETVLVRKNDEICVEEEKIEEGDEVEIIKAISGG